MIKNTVQNCHCQIYRPYINHIYSSCLFRMGVPHTKEDDKILKTPDVAHVTWCDSR